MTPTETETDVPRAREIAAAQQLHQRVAESPDGVRRKVSTLLAYFGAARLTRGVQGRIATALRTEGIIVDPPLDAVSRDAFVRLKSVDADSPTTNSATARREGIGGSRGTRELPDLVEATSPAVMHIETGDGLGSGFGVDSDGFLLTNAHVVDPSGDHNVRLSDGSTHPAKLVGYDSSTDFAVLSIPPVDLPALTFRALKTVRVGEAVVAVGSPLGLSWTVTAGIVSGLERTITAPDGQQIDYVVQTDAQINPGNSGGPLIDRNGVVVGVNAQGVAPGVGSGVGFAIPSDTACAVYEEIREHGEVVRGAIGARAAPMPFFGDQADELGQDGGARLTSVRPDGPAATSGLHEGDIVLSLDGELVDEPGDLFRLLNRNRIGKECRVRLLRNGEPLECTVSPCPRRH